MNAPTAGAGGPGSGTPEPGSRRPSGVPEGQRQDPVSGADRLHVVFGTGQVGSALAAHLAGLGIPVRTVSRHRPPALPGGGVILVNRSTDMPATPFFTSVHRIAPRKNSPIAVATPESTSARMLSALRSVRRFMRHPARAAPGA